MVSVDLNGPLLISIHPKYAEKIFSGEKTIELRKQRPRISPGDRVIVYASSPRKEIIGEFQVKALVISTPKEVWAQFRKQAVIRKDDYDLYYSGKQQAVGIQVGKLQPYPKPISLEECRKKIPDFHPPQSFRYSDVEKLIST